MRHAVITGILLLAAFALAVCADPISAQQVDLPTTSSAGVPLDANFSGTGQYVPPDTTGYAFRELPCPSTKAEFDQALSNAQQGHIERLPPVDGFAPKAVDPAAKYGQDFPGGLLLPDDDVVEQEQAAAKGLPPGMRRAGCFQGISLGGSWLATGTGNDALGIAESNIQCEFVLPSLVPQSFMTITPNYGIHRFDNPGNHDIPGEVHDAAVGFGMRGRCNERLSYQTNVAVGSYSDFENGSGDQVRVRGYGSGMWKWSPTVDLTFGVAYVDLEDWPVLPIGGLIIRPDELQVLRITFPRMAYSRRLCTSGKCGCLSEYWGTISLELGGGSWIVQTRNDTTNEMTYRDWRLAIGLQKKRLETYDLNFDIGYVFGRRIEYEDEHESFAPDDTFSLTLTGRF